MNPVAARVIDEKMTLQGECMVHINDLDVYEITERFDTYHERIIALGVLCYAKVYADDKGEFKLSHRTMCNWLDVNHKTLVKYLNLLEELHYIKKLEAGDVRSWYQKTVATPLNKYRILVDIDNHGKYELVDNDIQTLYDVIFVGINPKTEQWYDIPGYHGWYQVSEYGRVRVCEREIGGRIYPAKLVRLFKSKSGRLYANLMGEDGRQKKISVQKLLEAAF